jgi:hypothetical protein
MGVNITMLVTSSPERVAAHLGHNPHNHGGHGGGKDVFGSCHWPRA